MRDERVARLRLAGVITDMLYEQVSDYWRYPSKFRLTLHLCWG